MLRRIARNTLSNWIGGVLAAGIAFVLTPFIVDYLKDPALGNQAYGSWTFIVAATAYFGLADLGVYQGVLQFFTRFLANRQVDEFNRTLSTGVVLLLITSSIALLIAVAVTPQIPDFLGQTGLDPAAVKFAFLLSAAWVILRLPLTLFTAVVVGCESFHVLNAILVVTKLVTAAATVGALIGGYGLRGLAVAVFFGALVEATATVIAAYRLRPELSVRLRSFRLGSAKQILGYGKWMFGRRVSDFYLANIDLMVVPALFGAEATAVYGLAITFVTYAQIPIKGFANVLTPTAIAADAHNSRGDLEALLISGSRFGLALAGMFYVGFLVWGEQFIFLWLDDPTFLWEAEYLSAAVVLSIVAIDRLLLIGLAGPLQILIGTRQVRLLSVVSVAQGLLGMVLAIIGGKIYGIVSIPIAIAMSALLGQIVITLYACRLVGVPISRFARNAVLRPLVAMILMWISFRIVARVIPVDGWLPFLMATGLCAVVAVCWGLLVCVTAAEKRSLRMKLGW